MFFGIFYSTPPIRAKVIPFIDSFFNILYIFPGVLIYGILSGSYPSIVIIIASTLWCMAMHAFSAVPDIESDCKANLNTIATFLGAKKTIAFCALSYCVSGLIAANYIGVFGFIGGFVYLITMVLAYKTKSSEELFRIYKFFPNINALVGFTLFWVIFFS
jgi:4-hydroxybenzoate polyprenyltransferase